MNIKGIDPAALTSVKQKKPPTLLEKTALILACDAPVAKGD
jgi:hypothetical protein